jgi:hypothetical protein
MGLSLQGLKGGGAESKIPWRAQANFWNARKGVDGILFIISYLLFSNHSSHSPFKCPSSRTKAKPSILPVEVDRRFGWPIAPGLAMAMCFSKVVGRDSPLRRCDEPSPLFRK